MSETWYRVSMWGGAVEPVEAERSTAKCLFIATRGQERKVIKESSWEWYYQDRDQAEARLKEIKDAKQAQTDDMNMRNAAQDLYEALWLCVEHNALHFGESHNTVIAAREALAKAGGES